MKIKENTFTRVVIATIIAFTMSSCVSTAVDPATMTRAEIAMRQEQNEDIRMAQGVVTGAALGAAGGALIAALAGGDSQAITRGAIAGGLVGGVAGGIDANNVNQGARAEAGQQDRYRQVIANADHNIAHYRKMNGYTSQLISEENARISQLNEQFKTGSIDRAAYRKKLSSARGNVSLITGTIGKVDRDIRDLQAEKRGGAPTGAKIAQLEAEKRQLNSQLKALRGTYDRVLPEVDLNVWQASAPLTEKAGLTIPVRPASTP